MAHPAKNCAAPGGGLELLILISHHGLPPVAKDKLRPRRGLLISVSQRFYICSPRSGRYIVSHGRQRLSDKPRKRDKCRHQIVAAAFRLRNTLKINKLCPAPRRLKPAATKTWFAGQPLTPVAKNVSPAARATNIKALWNRDEQPPPGAQLIFSHGRQPVVRDQNQ